MWKKAEEKVLLKWGWTHGSDISVWVVSVPCETQGTECLNRWHNTHTINLMVQKVQECMFLETSQCFCLTSPGEVGCWRVESLEEHPYNKGWMKVSASSQKSWDSKWTKKSMFHGENIIWWKKRPPEKSRHITDNLCMQRSKIVYRCWHCSQRWWSQPVMLGVVAVINEMTQGALTLCKSVYTKSNISNLL